MLIMNIEPNTESTDDVRVAITRAESLPCDIRVAMLIVLEREMRYRGQKRTI